MPRPIEASDPPEPEVRHLTRSAARRGRFEAILAGAWELTRIQEQVQELLSRRPVSNLDGVRGLVQAICSGGGDAQGRLAEAIGVDPATLDGVRTGELSVGDVIPEVVVRLGRTLGVDRERFLALAGKDLEQSPGVARDPDGALRDLAAAWDALPD